MLSKSVCMQCMLEHNKRHWKVMFSKEWKKGNVVCPIPGHSTTPIGINQSPPEWCKHLEEHLKADEAK